MAPLRTSARVQGTENLWLDSTVSRNLAVSHRFNPSMSYSITCECPLEPWLYCTATAAHAAGDTASALHRTVMCIAQVTMDKLGACTNELPTCFSSGSLSSAGVRSGTMRARVVRGNHGWLQAYVYASHLHRTDIWLPPDMYPVQGGPVTASISRF